MFPVHISQCHIYCTDSGGLMLSVMNKVKMHLCLIRFHTVGSIINVLYVYNSFAYIYTDPRCTANVVYKSPLPTWYLIFTLHAGYVLVHLFAYQYDSRLPGSVSLGQPSPPHVRSSVWTHGQAECMNALGSDCRYT